MKLLPSGDMDVDFTDDRDERIADLEADVKNLQAEVQRAQAEAKSARREATRALSALRQQLTPLYRAMQMVFGELDAAGVDDAAPTGAAAQPPRVSAIWEAWKARMPGGPAKIIDALLLQPDLNTQQLAIAIGVHRNSIGQMIWKLNKAGLLQKNGNRFSLKAL